MIEDVAASREGEVKPAAAGTGSLTYGPAKGKRTVTTTTATTATTATTTMCRLTKKGGEAAK